jgi:hypothetical protein
MKDHVIICYRPSPLSNPFLDGSAATTGNSTGLLSTPCGDGSSYPNDRETSPAFANLQYFTIVTHIIADRQYRR